MQQVRDDLGVFGVCQRGADDARLAVVQPTHRVEQMRETAGTGSERGHTVFVTAIAVADLRHDAHLSQMADEIQMARHFGRERQHADRRQCAQRCKFLKGTLPRRIGLCAPLSGIDEWTFEMRAEYARRARRAFTHRPPDSGQSPLDILAWRGHRGR